MVPGEIRPPELAELADAWLVRWDAGFGKDEHGRRVQLRPPRMIVTEAGIAALLFFELGRTAA